MQADVALIGGTGVGERLTALGGRPFHIPTAKGMVRGRVVETSGVRVLLLSRHSAGHSVPPHRVGYLAMALALQSIGLTKCLATAAVGSLRAEWGPGAMVACSDFLDFTGRNLTLFDRTVVHRDFSEPFAPAARSAILSASSELSIPVEANAVYVCANGPRYETPQEIHLYRQLGGDVVGMTAASEAIAMREAEIAYGCLAIVTNFAAGMTAEPLRHQEVVDEMNRSGKRAVSLLLAAAKKMAAAP